MSQVLLSTGSVARYSLLSLSIGLAIAGATPTWAQDKTTGQGDDSIALDALTVTGEAADRATTEGTESYTTGAMNTATRLDLSVRHTPQSVSVVTRQMMDDMALESITDVVNMTTGVSSKTIDSSRSGFSARGFDITNLQIDGVPTTWSSGWAAGETEMDTLIYDRIEIVRGASGLISGAGNPSAAINLVRKRADSREFRGFVSGSAGTWDRYQGSLDMSNALNESGTVRGRLVASYLQQDDSYIDLEKKQKSVLYGTLGFDLSHSTLLNIGASYQENNPEGSMWGGLPTWYSDGTRTDWSRSSTTAADWTEWSSRHTTYFVNVEHQFDSGARLYAAYSKSLNEGDLRLLYLSGAPDRNTGLGMNASPTWYDVEREQDNLDIYASLPFSAGGRDHEVTVGLMHSKQELVNDRRARLSVPAVGDFHAWDGSYPEPEWGPSTTYTTQDTEQLGGYAVARLSLADPLQLIIGSRISNWKTSGMKWDGSQYSFKHNQVLTPYAGLIYDINEQYSAYISYSDIFNPQDYQDSSGDYLDPLEGKNYEAGLKAEYLDGRLNASLAVFRIEQDNLAQPDVGQVVPGGVAQAYYPAQGTTSDGYEIELSGALTENWNLLMGWAQFSAKDAEGDYVNTRFPRRTANLFTTYQFDRLTLGGGLNWEDSNFTRANNPLGQAEKLEQDAYVLVNVMARYQVNEALSAQLNINNLLDKKYYSQIGFYSQHAFGAPRHGNLTVKYSF
ncbi:TonB-dependent siderophore receptor [Halopseudomonas salegens]|uniref:Outer-membrane receptor for ferric coprogen and ferric-rhodotorulic acid n=1 Tax=Halopseudomonas salegens TaxID=1434072 RepID=A0A1H2F879_9GAMM|nr:TonB-dependent siderophore receptor [Halopseudomonas salegens]SDU03532.1 outer-membrane receptor for ferric coprogen and ferric-rhodotorulic acid [Halopseudomonas salegens]